ncbi:MAG: HAMP domain-containing histidine kinase [Candidatus Obscuribacterales bacterium]|nr:HAMP domain-containing histidine kinase [Candidatus Obscuribacterales bacterium]
MKLGIVGKGLILVAVPLLFELLFVACLVSALNEADAKYRREIRCQAAVEQSTNFLRSMLRIAITTGLSAVSGRRGLSAKDRSDVKKSLDSLSSLIVDNRENRILLKRVVESSGELLAKIDEVSALEPAHLLESFSGGSSLLDQVENLLYRVDRNIKTLNLEATRQELIDSFESKEESNYLKNTLYAGMALSICLSVMLALEFASSISSRLKTLAENTRRLSRKLPPLPMLTGKDELSMLDLSIHQMSAQMQSAELQRKQLSAMVKSRLQEPLTEAQSILTRLDEAKSNFSEPARKWLGKSRLQLMRLISLLNDLTQLQQIESGQIEIHPCLQRADEILQKSIDAVLALAEKKGIRIISSGPALEFYCDGERIIQVLVNLLSNAVKYSPSESLIELKLIANGEEIEFRVKDQGPGIPKDAQEKIFLLYEQSRREDATKRGGAGLGLNISMLIATAHKGILKVESEEGKGSEFILKVPLRKDQSLIPLGADPRSDLFDALQKQKGCSFKIRSKGLVLVAVPLLLQFAFLFVLSGMLEKAELETRKELQSIEIARTANAMFRFTVTMTTSSAALYFTGKSYERNLVVYAQGLSRSLAGLNSLFEFHANSERGKLLVSRIFQRYEKVSISTAKFWLMQDSSKNKGLSGYMLLKKRAESVQVSLDRLALSISELLAEERLLAARSAAETASNRAAIEKLIAAAVLISILITLFLGLFFSKSISKRLAVLIENTLRFSQSKPLLSPLKGSDELVEFDRDFRMMAAKIRANQEFKRHLLALVSHELRTPLTSIHGALTSLTQGVYGPLDAADLADLHKASNDIQHVIQLVNDLLDIERMEAGKFPLSMNLVDSEELLKQSFALANQVLPRLSFEIRNSLSEPLNIYVDPELFIKAFSRLLIFCCGQLLEAESIPVSLSAVDKKVILCINDYGNRDFVDSNFENLEIFQSLGESDEKTRNQMLLSLALCKSAFALMRGVFSVSAAKPKSPACFRLELSSLELNETV